LNYGDRLKTSISLLVAFCFLVLSAFSCLAAADSESSDEEILKYDTGYLTGISSTSATSTFAEAVRFTPPNTPWTLTKVQIAGWNGFENNTLPSERTIGLEVRDQYLNLLYQFADSQIPYFTDTRVTLANIEVPPLTVDGDFYVCFYDRGAVFVGYNSTDPNDRSYFYNRFTGALSEAKLTVDEGSDQVPINWLIRAVGHR
jgi:hypothetical protein